MKSWNKCTTNLSTNMKDNFALPRLLRHWDWRLKLNETFIIWTSETHPEIHCTYLTHVWKLANFLANKQKQYVIKSFKCYNNRGAEPVSFYVIMWNNSSYATFKNSNNNNNYAFFFWNTLEKVLKLANQSYPCANVITFFNTGTSPTCNVPFKS